MDQHLSQPQCHITLDEQSNHYEAASKCFKIVSAPEKGRYAVATSDLKPGNIVLQVALVVILMTNYGKLINLQSQCGTAKDTMMTMTHVGGSSNFLPST